MDSDRKTAIVVGSLFISATVASLLGAFALGSVLQGSDYLLDLSDQGGRVIAAVLLYLVAASSAFATAFLLFPILRRHAEGLAAGYVVLRTFENVFYVASSVALLTMLTISQSDALVMADPAQVPLMGAALLAFQDWSVLIGTLIFSGLGVLTLNSVLYRSRLVPRWLSGWGIVAAPLVFLYGLLGILGFGTQLGSPFMLLAMPLALQEMVFAVWLIAKGFHRREIRLEQPQPTRVPVPT
jgi:hypothetical protein